MSRTIAVAVFLYAHAVLSGQARQTKPAGAYSAPADINVVIDQWAKANGDITVDGDARGIINNELGKIDDKLRDTYPARTSPDAGYKWVKAVVVETYLYVVHSSSPARVIKAAEVQAVSLVKHVDSLRQTLSKPVGRLEVASNPTGAAIEIDGKGNLGRTFGVFVVAAATPHNYQILSDDQKLHCKDRVNVNEGETARVNCPALGRK